MLKRLIYALCLFALLSPALSAQTGRIWIEPDTTYFPRDTFLTFTVKCDAGLVDFKGIHFDLDMNGSGIVIAPADDPADTTVQPGNMFVDNDTMTFFWNTFWTDSTRLTADIFVLTDSQTVSGPGDLLVIRMNTVRFGASDVTIAGLKIRDRFNQEIPVTAEDAWIRVCQFVGDVNADNRILIDDLTYLVAWLWKDGPDPIPLAAGDLDCSGDLNVADITTLVAYLFLGGTICDACL